MKKKTPGLMSQEEIDQFRLNCLNDHFKNNDIMKTERSVNKYLDKELKLSEDMSSQIYMIVRKEVLSKDEKLCSLDKELRLLDQKIAALNMMRDICADDIQTILDSHTPEIEQLHKERMWKQAKHLEDTKYRLLKLALS